jgi:methionyl-tRNA formyltransferase
MKTKLRIFLLAYQDNPVGRYFLKAFLDEKINLTGIIIEDGAGGGKLSRLRKKIDVDGFSRTIYRLFQVYSMKLFKNNIVGLAKKHNIEVFKVEKFNSKECEKLLSTLNIDLLVIASAPILKDYIFSKARLGCLNTHPGWLPKYRGLGANAYAIKNGDPPGVSLHFIDAGVDLGTLILREKIEIKPRDTIAKINERAVTRGAVLATRVTKQIQKDRLKFLEINEPPGENYLSMPYSEAKLINKKIRTLTTS